MARPWLPQVMWVMLPACWWQARVVIAIAHETDLKNWGMQDKTRHPGAAGSLTARCGVSPWPVTVLYCSVLRFGCRPFITCICTFAPLPFHAVVVMKILSPGCHCTGSTSGRVLDPAVTVLEMRVHVNPCTQQQDIFSGFCDLIDYSNLSTCPFEMASNR